jgi:hypothetical protein
LFNIDIYNNEHVAHKKAPGKKTTHTQETKTAFANGNNKHTVN